jgi:hypothetical protein
MKRTKAVDNKEPNSVFNEIDLKNLNNFDIQNIKDAFYGTMDNLCKLTESLEKTGICSEQKIAQKALSIMKKSSLEHLWMKF